MDIGQQKPNVKQETPVHRPFARPKLKRRRTLPPKPAAICVRANPSHYFLDFSEHSKRLEKAVCHHVLSDKRFISIVGLPGCGKTVILRGVAYQRSVQEAFREGIFLIPFSINSTRASLFEHLREVLEKAGLASAAADLRDAAAVEGDTASKAAVSFFVDSVRDKNMLLMLDNVSEVPTVLYQILLTLCDMLRRGKREKCKLVTSTRSVEIAKAFGSSAVVEVSLPDADSDVARAIMCCHAGFDRMEFDDSCAKEGNLVIPVLEKCGGLPLALAVAGGAVKRLLANGKTPEEREQIWGHYRTYLCGSFDQFGQISGLFDALKHLVERVPREREWRTELTAEQAVAALAVVPNRVWVPYQVLQRTWGLKRKEDVITVVRPLAKMCLVSRARRGMSVGVVVPNIVLEYCRFSAQKSGQTKKWHLKLLRSYVEQGQRFAAVVQVTEDEGGVKWERSKDEDDYLRENLKHHTETVLRLQPTEEEEQLTKTAVEIVANKFLKPLQSQQSEAM